MILFGWYIPEYLAWLVATTGIWAAFNWTMVKRVKLTANPSREYSWIRYAIMTAYFVALPMIMALTLMWAHELGWLYLAIVVLSWGALVQEFIVERGRLPF